MIMKEEKNDIFLSAASIIRHRIGTEGYGIRTLIITEGCPLRCRYCFIPHSWDGSITCKKYSPEELYDRVKIDDLYFQVSNGGLTFGGGEPIMQAEFIHEMHRRYPMWSINIETSLNCDWENVQIIAEDIDMWFIDIKDMNSEIYYKYTGKDNADVLNNLRRLIQIIPAEKLYIRVPLIAGFNTEADIEKSVEQLKKMGFVNLNTFEYTIEKTK